MISRYKGPRYKIQDTRYRIWYIDMLTVCVRVIVTIIMSNRYGTNKCIYMVLKKDVIHVYWSYHKRFLNAKEIY